MSETIINTKALPELLIGLIQTEKVRFSKSDDIIQLVPVKDNIDCTIGLRGLLADCPEMSVYKFLERKHIDKELDL